MSLDYPYDTRPLEHLHDRDEWDSIPPQWVAPESLTRTHDSVSAGRLLDLGRAGAHVRYEGGEYMHVVAHRGRLYVHDGHHRLTLHQLRNPGAVILARVVAIESPREDRRGQA